jgi:hypothetical protein
MGPGAGLNYMEKRKVLHLPRLELPSLGCPARSHSLCRLRYPSSQNYMTLLEKSSVAKILKFAST